MEGKNQVSIVSRAGSNVKPCRGDSLGLVIRGQCCDVYLNFEFEQVGGLLSVHHGSRIGRS